MGAANVIVEMVGLRTEHVGISKFFLFIYLRTIVSPFSAMIRNKDQDILLSYQSSSWVDILTIYFYFC